MTHGFEEVTPTEASVMLDMSRPQVRRMMDRGMLPFRMVGTHHRIRVSDIHAFNQADSTDELTEVRSRDGKLEAAPPKNER